jgi:hypothetical protein
MHYHVQINSLTPSFPWASLDIQFAFSVVSLPKPIMKLQNLSLETGYPVAGGGFLSHSRQMLEYCFMLGYISSYSLFTHLPPPCFGSTAWFQP